MTAECPGTVLALQQAVRDRDAHIRRLEAALHAALTMVQRGRIDNTDLPMVDMIRQLIDSEQP